MVGYEGVPSSATFPPPPKSHPSFCKCRCVWVCADPCTSLRASFSSSSRATPARRCARARARASVVSPRCLRAFVRGPSQTHPIHLGRHLLLFFCATGARRFVSVVTPPRTRARAHADHRGRTRIRGSVSGSVPCLQLARFGGATRRPRDAEAAHAHTRIIAGARAGAGAGGHTVAAAAHALVRTGLRAVWDRLTMVRLGQREAHAAVPHIDLRCSGLRPSPAKTGAGR